MNNIGKTIKSVATFPVILILAWIIAHMMAVFGAFATVAYPVWAIFFGKKTVCLGCTRTSVGEKCALCGEVVKSGELYPKNVRSIGLNMLVLLFLTSISIGVVYLENLVIDSTGILSSGKTVSFNIPDKNQYRTNEIFPMKIEISGIKTSINVVQADLTFDPDILEVVEVSTKDSFATIFLQKDINNNLGYVRLTGGIPSPGYSQPVGTFGTIYFKAKNSGLATVSFLPTSMVLADDGRATNVLKSFPSVSYIVKPESLTKEEEVSQAQLFQKDVLGASTSVLDPNICKIELTNGTQQNDVLGISTSVNDQTDTSKPQEKTFDYILKPIIAGLHWFNLWVLSFYTKILSNIFTK